MPVVYIDVLFAVNFIINLFLLAATGIFSKKDLCWWRILLAAGVGTCYCLVVLFPSLVFFQAFFIKIAVSVLMVMIGYTWNWKAGLRLTGVFYLVTFGFAGAVLAFVFFQKSPFYMEKGVFYLKLPVLFFLLAAFTLAYLIFDVARKCIKRHSLANFYFPIRLTQGGKTLQLKGFMDTGNSLSEPLTGLPVLIVSQKSLRPLFGQMEQVADLSRMGVLPYVIPCETVSSQGMILGFLPQKLEIGGEIKKGIVGIFPGKFTGDYDGLINPEFMTMEAQQDENFQKAETVFCKDI